MGAVRITPPSYQPITLAQARAQCRIDADNATEDTLFTSVWIPAVVDTCEQILCRSIMKQTWRLTLDDFADEIALPWPNVLAVSAVEYRHRGRLADPGHRLLRGGTPIPRLVG